MFSLPARLCYYDYVETKRGDSGYFIPKPNPKSLGWVVVCKPILVFSFSFDQAKQYCVLFLLYGEYLIQKGFPS